MPLLAIKAPEMGLFAPPVREFDGRKSLRSSLTRSKSYANSMVSRIKKRSRSKLIPWNCMTAAGPALWASFGHVEPIIRHSLF